MLDHGHHGRLERDSNGYATFDLERLTGRDDQIAQVLLLGYPEHTRATADTRAKGCLYTHGLECL
jgi:hypothetical protein